MGSLRDELNLFWEWAKMTPSQYAEAPVYGEWEVDYPYWERIYQCAEIEISKIKDNSNISAIFDVLESLAIDNESENILFFLVKENDAAHVIIKKGYNCNQPHARWQIAELIKRLNHLESIPLLKAMIFDDADKYVQRRALLSLFEVSILDAKECALKKANDDDDKIRSVCNDILKSS